MEATVDTESILGDVLNREQEGAEWKRLHAYLGVTRSFDELEGGDDDAGFDFEQELNEIDDLDDNGANEGELGYYLGKLAYLPFRRGIARPMEV